MTPSELFVGGDEACDLGVERGDVAGDLFEALAARAPKQRYSQVLFAVLERGTIAHQSVAGVDEFGQLVLLWTACRPDRRL